MMKRYNNLIKESLLLILGNFILAIAVGIFILPNNVLSGGVAGAALLLKPFIDINEETLVTILTWTLFVIGYLLLGKKFALKTLASSILYPVFLYLVTSLNYNVVINPFLATLYGGILMGIGVGVVIRTGASTGGMDIPALILHKYLKSELTLWVLLVDSTTVIFGLFIYGLEAVLYGIIAAATCSLGISISMSYPWSKMMSVTIISKHWNEINQAIIKELDRGSTIQKAIGGYTNEEKNVILVVVDKHEYKKLLDIIHRYDQGCFVIANETNRVFGEGFSLYTRV